MLYPDQFGEDPLFPKSTDFGVIIKDALSGRGVMAFRTFSKGEIIARMAGHITHEIRQHTLQLTPEAHLYDPYFSGYFLHSCSPNISLNMNTLLVTALKDITANSFLYMDYAETEDVLFKQFPCSCGTAECRGWITGKKEMIRPDLLQPELAGMHRSFR